VTPGTLVCIKVVDNVFALMKENGKKVTDKAAVEDYVRKYCLTAKITKENRFCYYVGGL
jgi:hypothetical protein